ncbi:MAG: DmsC/YnfH family molybdoenzyme membrane anchor subunit [Bacteroidota bacterium]
MSDKGFIFDYSRCVGCHACMVACYNQNHTEPPMAWRMVVNGNPIKIPLKGFINLSIACNHCVDAPCMVNCPAIAYSKDNITGAIVHNHLKCIGCKYCTWACPYEAPKFNPAKGVIEKCNFCNDLLKEGGIPACAGACPTGALTYGDIKIEPKLSKPGFPEVETSPRINAINDTVERTIPEMDIDATGYQQSNYTERYAHRIRAPKEMPLIFFTFLSAVLVGWFITFYNFERITLYHKIAFISLQTIAGLISLFHLGKPFRAFRALNHIKSSWLSREIALFGVFTLLGSLCVLTGTGVLYGFALIVGLAFLISVEMVYHVTRKDYRTPIHSANTLLTAVAFASLILISKEFILFALIKLVLYLSRHAYEQKLSFKRFLLSLLRFLALLLPFVGILFGTISLITPFVILFLVGEFIDRYEYYTNIDTHNPFQSI